MPFKVMRNWVPPLYKKFESDPNLLRAIHHPLNKFTPEQRQSIDKLLSDSHESFKEHVENSREGKLKLTREQRENELYQAGVYLGNKALE